MSDLMKLYDYYYRMMVESFNGPDDESFHAYRMYRTLVRATRKAILAYL